MTPSAQGDDTQTLSDYDREKAAREAAPDRAAEGQSQDFARLVPRNPAARQAFHELALMLSDLQWLPHSRKFMYVDDETRRNEEAAEVRASPRQHSSSPSASSLSEEEEPVSPISHTGVFRFNFSIPPADWKHGWTIGAGRADKPNFGVDFLITLNAARDLVRGRHAQVWHHRKTGVLMLRSVIGGQQLFVDSTQVGKEGTTLSRVSQSVEIGNLSYTLEFESDPTTKSHYAKSLRDMMKANPSFTSYELSTLDPTPAVNHYQVQQYSIQTPQAAGAYGIVSAAVHVRTGEVYAVKKLNRKYSTTVSIEREIQVMRKLGDHPHVCKLAEVLSTGSDAAGEVFMILSPLAIGTLRRLVILPEDRLTKLRALHHAAQGLRHICARGIIHRDLKPDNFLIAEPFRIVVADFGHATHEQNSPDHMKGTLEYLPPEIRDFKLLSSATGYWSFASDVFAYGIVGYELFHGLFERPRRLITDDILDDIRSKLDTSLDEIDILIREMLSSEPHRRPAIGQICLNRIWPEPETAINTTKRKSTA